MSTRRFRASVDNCLPVLELMEPRLLLSAAFATVSAIDLAPLDTDLPLYVDFVPVVRDHHPVIRDGVIDMASAIADLKAEDANADASTLSIPGIGIVNPAGEIKVMIRFYSDQADILAALAASGFRAGTFHQSQGSTTGWVSYADLEAVAEVAGVKEISFSMPGITNTGSITSAGDGILNADDLRSLLDVDGTGVKIGVISDGVADWQAVEGFGDLPETITIDQARPGTIGKNEGTAMMEIIYDLAPEVDLYFSGPTNSDEMQDSIDWLVGQGCDIIVDDLSCFDQPMFQDGTGTVAEAALDAIEDGVVYVTAAGNFAETHYQADFNAAQDNTHLFAQSQNLLRFYLGGYSSVSGYLQWSDEWGASGNNYNLYLYQYSGGNWVQIASSTVTQNGDDDPLEAISVSNTGAGTVLLAWLAHKVGGSGRELELYTVGNVSMYDSQLVVPGDSIFGHAAANGVIAVGAIDASDSGNDDIEAFSSQGPSTIYTDFANQTSTTRNSLDVAGIDGVSTKAGVQTYFYEPFYGTSAAAPHVAAIAALLKEINPNLTPGDIVDLLNDNAVDLGAAGYDAVFGSGRVDALAIVSTATGTPDLTAASDTGASDEDDITKLDNSASGKELVFYVTGTISGATVTLYACMRGKRRSGQRLRREPLSL